MATSRASGDSDSGAGSHEGVLTSLLNEMDGVQELLGVTVVAATNRPAVIVRDSLLVDALCTVLNEGSVLTGFCPDATRASRPYSVCRTTGSEGT